MTSQRGPEESNSRKRLLNENSTNNNPFFSFTAEVMCYVSEMPAVAEVYTLQVPRPLQGTWHYGQAEACLSGSGP